MITEYIYLDDGGKIMYTSRNHPLKYEDQTDCIKIAVDTHYDMDRILDLMGLGKEYTPTPRKQSIEQ